MLVVQQRHQLQLLYPTSTITEKPEAWLISLFFHDRQLTWLDLQKFKMQIVIHKRHQPPSQPHSLQQIHKANSVYPGIQVKYPQKQSGINPHASDDLEVRQRPMFQIYEIKDEILDEVKPGNNLVKQAPKEGQSPIAVRADLAQFSALKNNQALQTNQAIKTNKIQLPPVQPQQQLQPLQSASEAASETANRVIGVFILIGMFGVLWIYGWASENRVVSSTSQPVNLNYQPLFSSLFILTALFTVIGFGLLFMHFKRMSETAIFTSLFITSLTLITSPFIQKFWYNIFITDFSSSSIATANPSYLLNQSLADKNINLDFYNLKFSLINAISQLVLMLGLFGRINGLQLTLLSLLYNCAWSLNHYLNISRANSSPDPRIFDDYQIASIYLFAGTFGLFSSLILKKPPVCQGFTHSNFSSMLAQVGTFFLFLSFCTNSLLFTQKSTDYTTGYTKARTYVWQQGLLNTFFALSASVICSYLGSILFGGKIHVRQSVLGTITGAIMFGSIAQVCNNIGAAMATGSFAGLFSAFFYHKIYTKINRRRVFDTLGITLIALVSLIATLGVAPLVIFSYYTYKTLLPTLPNTTNSTGTAITSSTLVRYMIQYVGITAAVGSVSGIVIGALMKIFDKFDADKVLDDKQFVSKSSGLKPAGQQKQKSESRVVSKLDPRHQNAEPVQSQKGMIPA